MGLIGEDPHDPLHIVLVEPDRLAVSDKKADLADLGIMRVVLGRHVHVHDFPERVILVIAYPPCSSALSTLALVLLVSVVVTSCMILS